MAGRLARFAWQPLPRACAVRADGVGNREIAATDERMTDETSKDRTQAKADLWTMPGHMIRRLHQASVSLFLEETEGTGHALTPVQFAALCAIRSQPRLDQATLAGLIAYDRVTIGGVVDRLVQKGLVDRRVSPRDRRARELVLTTTGDEAVATVTPAVLRAQQRTLDGLDESERATFLALLEKATAAANDHSRAPLKRD